MAIHFAIDPRKRLVAYVIEGNTTAAETCEFLDAVIRHPDYRCGFDFFGDRRGVESPEPIYVYAVAAEINARARQLAPCLWAVVVSDLLGFGMTRMWALLAEESGVIIHPFRDSEEAVAWLNLPANYSPQELVERIRLLTV
jgi:hypothetical protein